MFKIDYFIFKYFLTSKIAVFYKKKCLMDHHFYTEYFFSEKQAILRNV
jgi:hypothetical protein